MTLTGLLLPEAIGYSCIANLPPAADVIALFAGLVCYGLIGTSRFAIVSTTSSSVAARISSVSDFIAKPVLRGFSFGLALIIILKQLAHVVGLHLQHPDVIRLSIELFVRSPVGIGRHWR